MDVSVELTMGLLLRLLLSFLSKNQRVPACSVNVTRLQYFYKIYQ